MLSQLLRYAPALELIRRIAPACILEVGCGSRGIGKFLSRRFVGVDLDFRDYTGQARRPGAWMLPVRADATRLPFRERLFDVVVLIDVLEHVPPETRPAVLRECLRVTRQWLVIGFPSDRRALAHDRVFGEWLHEHRQSLPGWLQEHLAWPFPEVEEVARVVDGAASETRVLDNAWLPGHRFVMRWEARERWAPYSLALSELLAPTQWDAAAHRAITNVLRTVLRPCLGLLRWLDRSPAYRKMIMVKMRGSG